MVKDPTETGVICSHLYGAYQMMEKVQESCKMHLTDYMKIIKHGVC